MNRHRILFSMFLSIVLFFSVSAEILAADVSDDDPQSNQSVTTEDDSNDSSVILNLSSVLTYQSSLTGSTYTIPSAVKANGIDVSSNQGTINWNSVAASKKVNFVFIRLGTDVDGQLYTDKNFVTNIEGAQAVGISVGVYFSSQATTTTEAQQEAQYVLNLVSSYNLELPVAIDYEFNSGLSKSQATAVCQTFCDMISSAHYVPMVYANYDFWSNHLDASRLASGTAIWYARFNSSPSYTGDFDVWQYSDSGSVSGISGDVDGNFSFVSVDKLGIPFTDVADGSWYLSSVHYAFQHRLFSGMTTTTFEPNTAMSRAMLVSVLYRLEGSPSVSGSTAFTDLNQSWYQNAVLWAYQNGIVSGTGATTFEPDTAITREQMAAILYRYSKTKGYDVSASGSLSGFSDSASISSYATTAMAWAVGEGYISGNGDGTLCPKASATRAQVASVLMRLCIDHES